jgi:peptide/nickel transport system permease protein
MIAAALRRIAWTAVVLWFVATTTFVVTIAIPADPARTVAGPHASKETLARVREHYCMDRGLVGRYGCWIDRVAHGDLGDSYYNKRPVLQIIGDRMWPSVQLALAAILLQLVIGVPLGVVAAIRRARWPDRAITAACTVGQAAPPFFVGSVLVYWLAYRWGWLPISGYGDGGWDRLAHLVLPAMTLAALGIAFNARVVRAELIDLLGQDYVRTARAKGLSELRVVGRHALRNALGPLVTLVGIDLGVLLGGTVVVELMFAWPGLGREMLLATLELDLPLILGVVLVGALAITLANLAVDLVYLWLDPRLREPAETVELA